MWVNVLRESAQSGTAMTATAITVDAGNEYVFVAGRLGAANGGAVVDGYSGATVAVNDYAAQQGYIAKMKASNGELVWVAGLGAGAAPTSLSCLALDTAHKYLYVGGKTEADIDTGGGTVSGEEGLIAKYDVDFSYGAATKAVPAKKWVRTGHTAVTALALDSASKLLYTTHGPDGSGDVKLRRWWVYHTSIAGPEIQWAAEPIVVGDSAGFYELNSVILDPTDSAHLYVAGRRFDDPTTKENPRAFFTTVGVGSTTSAGPMGTSNTARPIEFLEASRDSVVHAIAIDRLSTYLYDVGAVVDGLPLHHQHIEAAVAQTQHNGTMLIREEAVAGTTPSAPTDPLGHLFGGNGR
jgi:hypothetical protein